MRKKVVIAVAVILVLAFIGSFMGQGNESNGDSATQNSASSRDASYEITPSDELSGLSLGQTAVFEDYEVTLESVEVVNNALVVSVTVNAHAQDQVLKASYLQGADTDIDIVNTSFEDGRIAVGAWGSTSGTITVTPNTIASLRWNNWSNEATWSFETSKSNYPTVSSNGEFDVSIVNITDDGITFALDYQDSSQDRCAVYISGIEIGGAWYPCPTTDEESTASAVQLTSEGESISDWWFELASGSSSQLTVSCSDIQEESGYHTMKIVFDDQTYSSSGGKYYTFKDLSIKVSE